MYWSEKRIKKSSGLGGGASGTLKNGFVEAVKSEPMSKNQPETF
jgi:hypothetical protein